MNNVVILFGRLSEANDPRKAADEPGQNMKDGIMLTRKTTTRTATSVKVGMNE